MITVSDSILSIIPTTEKPLPEAGLHAGSITLNGSILYHQGISGTDPDYEGPIVDWEIAPPNAFNSNAFPTKGYQGQGTATAIPAAPSSAVATLDAAQSNHVDLTWTDNSTNEAGFRIERSANGGSYSVIGSTGTNATRYMDTGLAHGVSYAYRIYAYNNVGSSSSYASVSRSTAGLSTPVAPGGVTVNYNPEQGPVARITWTDNSTNESAFQVQRGYNSTNFAVIATVTENTEAYVDATIPPNTTVHYRIRALNSAGGANSGSQSFTLPWVVIVDNLDSNVEISPTSPQVWVTSTAQSGYWESNYHANTTPGTPASFGFVPAVPSTGSYEVYLRWTSHSGRANNVPVDIIHAGGTSTVTVNQRAGGSVWQLLNTYTFNAGSTGKIVIRNTGVNGAVIADAVYLRAVATGGPTAPVSLAATAAGGTSVNLTWSDQSNNETGFAIERSADGSGFAIIGSAAANATSHTDNTAIAGLTYYYRVRAALNGTLGGASNDAQTFTPLTLTLDNAPSSEVIHTPTNGWISSTTQPGAHNGEYVHDDNSSATTLKTLLFRPTIPGNGTYQVQARWTAASNRATNVRFLINGTVGRQPVIVNQTTKHNQWVTLGTVTFRAGTSGTVLLTNEGANNYVIGDAVRFIRVAP